ncbi:hypothetical protein [Povalibacter sp.]|uniref:hypothetical protein n=1 Tax=Povalibacter sp. TaxID=1962978 RepID=UPI002F414712
MTGQVYQSVAERTDEASARILLGQLQSESIPARLRSNVPVPGLGLAFHVEVAPGDVQRARDVLQASPVSDEELAALAMSTKPPETD